MDEIDILTKPADYITEPNIRFYWDKWMNRADVISRALVKILDVIVEPDRLLFPSWFFERDRSAVLSIIAGFHIAIAVADRSGFELAGNLSNVNSLINTWSANYEEAVVELVGMTIDEILAVNDSQTLALKLARAKKPETKENKG